MTTVLDHLLVPLDGSLPSEHALRVAQQMAAPDGEITLLRVVPHATSIQDPVGGIVISAEELETQYRDAATTEIAAAKAHLPQTGPSLTEQIVEANDVADAIARVAGDHHAGMIVMASTGRGAFGRLALGSVTDRVTRSAHLPVMVVKRHDDTGEGDLPPVTRIVVPVDGSDRSRMALPVALDLAKRFGIGVHLVAVVDLASAAPTVFTYGAAFSQQLYQQVMTEIGAEVQIYADELAAECTTAGVTATTEITEGQPAARLLQLLQTGDVVVMTTHGRSGFKRWLIGSVAEKMIRQSPVPVVIVPARPA